MLRTRVITKKKTESTSEMNWAVCSLLYRHAFLIKYIILITILSYLRFGNMQKNIYQ